MKELVRGKINRKAFVIEKEEIEKLEFEEALSDKISPNLSSILGLKGVALGLTPEHEVFISVDGNMAPSNLFIKVDYNSDKEVYSVNLADIRFTAFNIISLHYNRLFNEWVG